MADPDAVPSPVVLANRRSLRVTAEAILPCRCARKLTVTDLTPSWHLYPAAGVACQTLRQRHVRGYVVVCPMNCHRPLSVGGAVGDQIEPVGDARWMQRV